MVVEENKVEAEENGLDPVPEKDLNGLRAGTNYLGRLHHPALGIRIPELFLPGIIAAMDKRRCAAGLMLSFGRETAPEEIINAPPGRYEITLGHTGTSIRKYLHAGARAARVANVPVEMEADHLIITESSALAVKRIEGIRTPKIMGPAAIEKSLRYNLTALDEAVATGVVRAFTTDTSDLFDDQTERMSSYALNKRFNELYPAQERERMLKTYRGKHRFRGGDGKPVRLELPRDRMIAALLKFRKSLEINALLYNEIRTRMKHPFAFEISMDETEAPTSPAHLFVYLGEWKNMGYECDFVAPNVGFQKREDFRDNLVTLKNRVRALNAIADRFGAMLSFHSGSGTSIHSGKGQGVYETLLEATGQRLKYKISGIYFELLIELLAGHKKGTDARILFELIFEEVMAFLHKQVEDRGPLDSKQLRKQLEAYPNWRREPDPRAEVFRHHSFLCLNFRDLKGRRYFRERLIRLYIDDLKLKKQVDQEIEALTGRLIEGLAFNNNF